MIVPKYLLMLSQEQPKKWRQQAKHAIEAKSGNAGEKRPKVPLARRRPLSNSRVMARARHTPRLLLTFFEQDAQTSSSLPFS